MKKTALITGSTSGIGLEIAKHLAKNGCDICINGLGEKEKINQIVNEITTKYRVNVIYSDANLLYSEDIKKMIDFTLSKLGKIDYLINNAGIQHVSKIEDFSEEKYEQIIKINLSAAFYSIKYAASSMKSANFGRIVNIASAHGIVASPFKSAYVASKHGVLGLTKSVALEVAENNISVNSVCPGYAKTEIVINQIKDIARVRGIDEDEVIRDIILVKHPNKRFVSVQEISDLVVFLCEQKTNSITGSHFSIDGGWTAQ